MVKNLTLRVILIFPLFASLVLFSGCSEEEPIEKEIAKGEQTEGKTIMTQGISDKKVAMIIAFTDFKDEEYFIPKEILEKAGLQITTVSNSQGIAQGVSGGEASVGLSSDELEVADYEGIVFIGGPGCLKNLDNQRSYQIAQSALDQNKVLAAICISPVILAKAGVLKDKKATVWSSPLDKNPIKILQDNEAVYQNKAIAVDGKIITANGPAAAQDFGQAIIEALKG